VATTTATATIVEAGSRDGGAASALVAAADSGVADEDTLASTRASVCSDGGGTPASALETLKDALPPHDAMRRSVKTEKLVGSRTVKNNESVAMRLDAHEGGASGRHVTSDVTVDVTVVEFVRPVAFVTQGESAVASRLRFPLPIETAPVFPAAASEIEYSVVVATIVEL
jgi:hypothetical protein